LLYREHFTGVWRGKSELAIKFSSIRLLDAFIMGVQKLACDDPQKHDKNEEGSEVEVETHNQFEIFAVAAVLQLKGLQLEAEEFIQENLVTETFMLAVRHALTYQSPSLLKLCFFWMKREGVRSIADRTPEGVWWEDVFFNEATKELIVGQDRCPTSAFDAVITDNFADKDHYFNGSHPKALPATPQNIPSAGTKSGSGFPDMTRCYVERRRGMGANADMTHFLVFSEDKVPPV
jgi:hypothetical protein